MCLNKPWFLEVWIVIRTMEVRVVIRQVRLQGQPEVHKGPWLLWSRGDMAMASFRRAQHLSLTSDVSFSAVLLRSARRGRQSVVLLLSFLCPCELLPCVGVFLRSLQTLPNTGTVILSLEGPSGQTRACPTVRLAVGLTSTRARSRGR